MVNIHQQPKHKSKLSNTIKFLLVLAALVLLVVYRGVIYALQKDKQEDAAQSDQITHNDEIQPNAQAPVTIPVISSPNQAPPTQATSSAPSAQATPSIIGKLKIISTPTGFLNVRSTPSTSGAIITQVSPGTIFSYTASQNGWYQIILPNNLTGWVSGLYTTLNLTASAPPLLIHHSDDGNRGEGE